MKRFALLGIGLALAASLVGGRAAASDAADAMATVNQYIDGFNKSDAKTMVAACASPANILDDFPPHVWSGATACADWWNAFTATAKKAAFTDNVVTVGKPWHVDVSGSLAYVVVPTTYTFKDHGKAVATAGVMTLVLKKTAAGWRITSWAWADH